LKKSDKYWWNNMSKKSKGGRPRKYSTDAERKKAYRDRQKKRMKELEKKVELLEKQLQAENKDENDL
jgi:hypothetical protein